MTLADTIRSIDYRRLPLSDYSRAYILGMLPAMEYYLEIYDRCLDLLLTEVGKPAAEVTLVDYGGGHGFFSFAAKERGVGRVIYVDINPLASEAAQQVKQAAGFGADVLLCGDEQMLCRWCAEHQVKPDGLAGMDVIEHIYRLEPFFRHLDGLNPQMAMVFSTGSTPFNPWVRRRLHRVMEKDECGVDTGFRELRRRYIAALRPDLTPAELDRWADATRGLTYEDITVALQQSVPPQRNRQIDRYNTCDPATGSWTERILPMATYRQLVAPKRLTLVKGFYNCHRRGPKGVVSRLLNTLLQLPCTKFLAPFIILKINAQ